MTSFTGPNSPAYRLNYVEIWRFCICLSHIPPPLTFSLLATFPACTLALPSIHNLPSFKIPPPFSCISITTLFYEKYVCVVDPASISHFYCLLGTFSSRLCTRYLLCVLSAILALYSNSWPSPSSILLLNTPASPFYIILPSSSTQRFPPSFSFVAPSLASIPYSAPETPSTSARSPPPPIHSVLSALLVADSVTLRYRGDVRSCSTQTHTLVFTNSFHIKSNLKGPHYRLWGFFMSVFKSLIIVLLSFFTRKTNIRSGNKLFSSVVTENIL